MLTVHGHVVGPPLLTSGPTTSGASHLRVNDALEHGCSCTLSIIDGGTVAPNQGRPVRLFGFGPKRVFGTERVTEISLSALLADGGRF
jgi:hypothetical protein